MDDAESLLQAAVENGGRYGNLAFMRESGWDQDRYFAARDRLLDEGKISRGRGKGGTIVVLEDQPSEPEPTDLERVAEASLYPDIEKVLANEWSRDERLTDPIVVVTAFQGRRQTGGKWSRPDLVVIALRQFEYLPSQLDVISFEVKPWDYLDVTAVYEAVSHRRAATRSYVLAWVPDENREVLGQEMGRVAAEARRHGIGLFWISECADYATWEVAVEAERLDPDPEALDAFLAQQLTDAAKRSLGSRIREDKWNGPSVEPPPRRRTAAVGRAPDSPEMPPADRR